MYREKRTCGLPLLRRKKWEGKKEGGEAISIKEGAGEWKRNRQDYVARGKKKREPQPIVRGREEGEGGGVCALGGGKKKPILEIFGRGIRKKDDYAGTEALLILVRGEGKIAVEGCCSAMKRGSTVSGREKNSTEIRMGGSRRFVL